MAAVKVTDSIYSVGILNPNMRVFDIVMSTDYGTTYNSYVLKGEKNVLIEACHKTYFEQYLANIREVIDPKNIDYIVLNHNEPDHSGALAQLLDYATNATVVVSKAGSIYLKNITNRTDLKVQVALDGDVIDIKVAIDRDMIEIFAGEKIAFTYRYYGDTEYQIGLMAQDGCAEFFDIRVTE